MLVMVVRPFFVDKHEVIDEIARLQNPTRSTRAVPGGTKLAVAIVDRLGFLATMNRTRQSACMLVL